MFTAYAATHYHACSEHGSPTVSVHDGKPDYGKRIRGCLYKPIAVVMLAEYTVHCEF